jgi:mannose-6-phosphate isomerase-like protein (cupin superfamily)
MKYTRAQAEAFEKHGVHMWQYFGKEASPDADCLYLEVNGGHYQEFRHTKSTFIYYVLEGSGTFYLNGEAIPVGITDVILAPKNTAIYYLGTMKLLLVTAPAWEEEFEEQIRLIEQSKDL